MTQAYDQYKTSYVWTIVEKAINDLVKNQDLQLTTNQEYVVGYISKEIFNSKANFDLRTKVLLSAIRAMHGAVTPNLRGVTVDYSKEWLTIRAYFDNGAGDDDKELIDVAMAEMMADLWQDIEQCRYEPVDLPFPNKMTVLKDWIVMRHEKLEDERDDKSFCI